MPVMPVKPGHYHTEPSTGEQPTGIDAINNSQRDQYPQLPSTPATITPYSSRHRRSRSIHSIETVWESHQDDAPLFPAFIVPASSRTSTTRLGHTSLHLHLEDGFGYIPTRPALRPTPRISKRTISFGGESRYSYTSQSPPFLDSKTFIVTSLDDGAPSQSRSLHEFLCYCTLCISNFVCGINFTSLSACVPEMAYDMALKSTDAVWIVLSFLLSAALVQPLTMRLAPAVGSKSLMLVAISLGLCGSIVSATSTSWSLLVSSQIMNGIACGMAIIVAQLVARSLYDGNRSASLEKYFWLPFWLGTVAGSIVGFTVSTAYAWRTIFWFNVPLYALVLVALPSVMTTSNITVLVKLLLKVDYLGWTLLAGSFISLTIGLISRVDEGFWSSWRVLAPISLALAGLVLGGVCTKVRTESILPTGLCRSSSACIASISTVAQGAIASTIFFFLPLFYATQPATNPVIQRTAALPCLATTLISAVMVSKITSAAKAPFWTSFGWLAIATSCAVMASYHSTVYTYSLNNIALSSMAGAGLGILLPTLHATIQNAASNDDETIHAAPLHTFLATLGAALGMAASSVIFLTSTPFHHTSQTTGPDHSLSRIGFAQNSAPDRITTSGMYSQAFERVWIFNACLASLMLVLSSLVAALSRRGGGKYPPSSLSSSSSPTPYLYEKMPVEEAFFPLVPVCP